MSYSPRNKPRGQNPFCNKKKVVYVPAVKPKPKSFEEMSKEEKIKFVNKQIDDLLSFIETNKQAKYNQWEKEFCNGQRNGL